MAGEFQTAAGFASWSKFWNSMRASRETDLMDQYGLRKACAWIGNSPAVAMKHYALLRKSDYTDLGAKSGAVETEALYTSPETKGLTSIKSDAKSGAAPARTGEFREPHNAKTLENQGFQRLKLPRMDSKRKGTH